jgi:NADH-quinone oxidoreductase subunit J
MSLVLFWCFALLMLGFGAAVVINRNPVASALSLVVSFLGLAALFILLDAFFIGVIQVLVYAGAVMVLFLFIIMLLDLRAERVRPINWPAAAGGIGVAIAFLAQVLYVVGQFKPGRQPFPPLAGSKIDDVHNVGRLLFDSYNLPFQVVGVLVLVASIGVIVLSARQLR